MKEHDPCSDSPLIIGEVRPEAQNVVEDMFLPYLAALVNFSTSSLRSADDARRRGDESRAAMYEAEATYFYAVFLDLLALLGKHAPNNCREASRVFNEANAATQGAMQ